MSKKETYVRPHKRKNPKSSGEHHVKGHTRKISERKQGGGRIPKKEKMSDSYKSREELIEQQMELEDVSREKAEELADDYIEKTRPDEGVMSYEAEKGDVLNFQSVFYPMDGRWMIKDIREHPRKRDEVVELVKVTKDGSIDKRYDSKLYEVSDIESSASKTEERKSTEGKSMDNQRVEFVESRG